jgi:hypothetical protein
VPKLSPLLPLSVFFLYRRHEKTGDIVGPCGTGFILERSFPLLSGVRHYYGVTNWHVACQTGASIIRINTKDGKSRFIDLDPSEWDFKRNFDDLVVIDLTDHLDSGTDQFSSIGRDQWPWYRNRRRRFYDRFVCSPSWRKCQCPYGTLRKPLLGRR